MIRTYQELITLPTFTERYKYLKLNGQVGIATFGHQRWLNQIFYHCDEWLSFKDDIIIRDKGRDLALDGFEINEPIYIHHLNPITYDDVLNRRPTVFDPNNVVCTKFSTHNAIHYGNENLFLVSAQVDRGRTQNDTCPWKR